MVKKFDKIRKTIINTSPKKSNYVYLAHEIGTDGILDRSPETGWILELVLSAQLSGSQLYEGQHGDR